MSFLYPLFLLAGLSVAVPIAIHLFNLRRYKTVYFPHTRFLKNIHLRSQKQAQIRYKWLLAARILFLLFLIIAFAQPFLKRNTANETGQELQVVYLDNSPSMSVKKGARTLFEMAVENVRKQLQQAPSGSRFLILTNDKPLSYQAVSAAKALSLLDKITVSAASKSATQIFTTIKGLMETEAAPHATVYYYSDFQKSSFPATPDENLLSNIRFYGMPLRSPTASNVFIDTAILTSPILKTGENNQLIVTTKFVGELPKEIPTLQLYINNQIKTAATLHFDEQHESIDTLSFQVNDADWQQITLTINDAVQFDDTFRIAARSNNNLAVLALNENQPNPFIQAAFRAYNGFKLDNKSVATATDWKSYNLVVLNGVTQLSEAFIQQLKSALQQGQSIAIFPGKTADWKILGNGLNEIASIQITGLDTNAQQATTIQQGSDMVKDIFEKMPANVQLPQTKWHYKIEAGLTANQQSILSFRNGDPLLAQFTPSRGRLYLLTTSADLQSGNFTTSYFFAPFLYQMTMQSSSGNVLVATAGTDHPVFLDFKNTDEQNMVHILGNALDVIPPQQAAGAGLEIYAGKVLSQAGYYKLTASGNDTVTLALNENRTKSTLDFWNLKTLAQQWKGKNIFWSETNSALTAAQQKNGGFPLWKVCAILALIMLGIETALLSIHYRKTSITAS